MDCLLRALTVATLLYAGLPAAAATLVDAVPCPVGATAPLPLPGLAVALEAPGAVTIVALGSSSTAGAGASSPLLAYPAQLQSLLRAAYPRAEIRVLNRGVGGEDAAEMLHRLDADVLAEQPQLVVWQVGVNAALRRSNPALFREQLAAGVARLRAAGAEVVLMDSQRGPWSHGLPDRGSFDEALADIARQGDAVLFSRGRLMDAWQAAGAPPTAMLVADGLHHNDRGYACLAAALAQAIQDGIRR